MNTNPYVRAVTEAIELAVARESNPPSAPEIRLREGRVWVSFADAANEVETATPPPLRDEPEGY